MRIVRDDPDRPDPGFAELYRGLPEAEAGPWLELAKAAAGPVLYLGIGAGRLAAPLARRGVDLVGVDCHPGMVELCRVRVPGARLVLARIEDLDLPERYRLVMAPSNILVDQTRLSRAARHLAPGGRLAFELINPHWLAAGADRGVEVVRMDRAVAALRVSYAGTGFVQEAVVPLVWPEEVEPWLGQAGLRLLRMTGEGSGLEEAATFHVVAATGARRVLATARSRTL